MKLKNFLPILLLSITFTACIERTVTTTNLENIAPEFVTNRENFKNKVSEIIQAEDIFISQGNTKTSGEEPYNHLTLEIVAPKNFPSSGSSFSGLANEVSEVVKGNIKNIEIYQKLNVQIRHTEEENGTEHTRSFEKEFDLGRD